MINKTNDKKLKEIILLHNVTKHFILLGEETDANFNSYIQPLKEFRDAYDHLMRAFRIVLFKDNKYGDDYVELQISKALEHEYRAFFDVADWFSIICRSVAQKAIEGKEHHITDVCGKYSKYREYAILLNGASSKIAEMREAKDVGGDITSTVNDYKNFLISLHDAAIYIQNAFITKDKMAI